MWIRSLALALFVSCLLSPSSVGQDCDGTGIGLIPLHDLAQGSYLGAQGGLFPGGSNHAPAAHDAAGLAAAAAVVPRAPSGTPDPVDGKLVLLSIGLSNTTQEWSQFMAQAAGDGTLNPALVIVDGAQGGVPASEAKDPNDPYWTVVQQRLTQAGVTPDQVAAVWLKTAHAGPSLPFPQDALSLRDDMADMVRNVKDLCPNAELLYLSSRIYAGYATTGLNPEPFAYQSGFAVKWLIEDQINGAPGLNHNPGSGAVEAPWLTWGPYLWADGTSARSDERSWVCSDFQPDGTHPGPAARVKVADQLQAFFATHASARPWYLAGASTACGVQARTESYGVALPGSAGAPRLVASSNPTVPGVDSVRLHAWGAAPSALSAYLVGVTPFAPGTVPFKGGSLLVDPLFVFLGGSNAQGKSWLALGAVPDDSSLCGAELFGQYATLDAGAVAGVALSRALRLRLGH